MWTGTHEYIQVSLKNRLDFFFYYFSKVLTLSWGLYSVSLWTFATHCWVKATLIAWYSVLFWALALCFWTWNYHVQNTDIEVTWCHTDNVIRFIKALVISVKSLRGLFYEVLIIILLSLSEVTRALLYMGETTLLKTFYYIIFCIS